MKKLVIILFLIQSVCYSQKDNSKLKFNLCFAGANMATGLTLHCIDMYNHNNRFNSIENVFCLMSATSLIYITFKF